MALAQREDITEAERVGRAYFEAHARQDLDTVCGLWQPGGLGRIVGLADLVAPHGIRDFFGDLYAAFPDFSLEVLDVTAQEDRCAVRWRIAGTFAGPGSFQGLTPTGARIAVEGVDVLQVRDGRVQGLHAYMDGADIGRQLGALPPRDSAAERRMTSAINLRTRLGAAVCEAPREVADGVWLMRGGLPARGFNVYFFRDGDGVALYDTGIRQMGPGLAAAGASLGGLTRVVLGHSHLDHRGGAAALSDVPVLCHADERDDVEGDGGLRYTRTSELPIPARWLYTAMLPRWDGGPVPVSETLEEGDEVAGFEVVHLPGHAPGLIGLWRASDRVAIAGDCFYMFDSMRLRPSPVPLAPPGPFSQDVGTARASMRKLAALDPALALPSHGAALRDNVRGALERAADAAG